jgi:DNA-binding IscR family transcriptional regulator
MLELQEEDQCCLLTDLMEEAESSWKSVLKRETVASMFDDNHKDRFKAIESLQTWVNDKMVL